MPKVKQERYSHTDKRYRFIYSINVNSEGEFTTTVPSEIAQILTAAGVVTEYNKLKRPGFFRNDTLGGLKVAIESAMAEALSLKLSKWEPVLVYTIETTCAYAVGDDGEIYPNCEHEEFGNGRVWRCGNQDAQWKHSYGFKIAVKPYIKKTYLRASGAEFIEYEGLSYCDEGQSAYGDHSDLAWLDDLTGMGVDPGNSPEVLYTEDMAKFFISMVKGLCMINEKIGELHKPEALIEAAQHGPLKLMSGKGQE